MLLTVTNLRVPLAVLDHETEAVARVEEGCATIDLLFAWALLLCLLIIFAIRPAGRCGALTVTYFLGLSLIHVPGVLPFIYSDWWFTSWDETRLGFEMTIIGMLAFVTGAIIARRATGWYPSVNMRPVARGGEVFKHLGSRALTIGTVAYFVLLPLSSFVPSLTAVVSAVATLLILGFWLRLYRTVQADDRGRLLATLALLPLLPLATLITGGFLGYGVSWVLAVLSFVFVIARRLRKWFYFLAPIAVYLGLSLFVTYMGQRTSIRDVVWLEESRFIDRLERTLTIVTEFQLLDLHSRTQSFALGARLNQNWLVGAAIRSHEIGRSNFAFGATVPLWALIPRVVWPNKPQVGGGRNIVTKFTGIRFGEGTSVGAGQVFEFYVNFGLLGVVVGFFAVGFLLLRLDYGIISALDDGDMRGFLLRAMPGLTLIQPGGNLLEISVACLAAITGAYIIVNLRFFGFSSSGNQQEIRNPA